MDAFTTPDQRWLHGVEDGIEYCLGRPSGMMLHFSDTIGFAIEQFLPALTDDSERLTKIMWDFADKTAVPLKDPKVRGLVHMLKTICDHRTFEFELNSSIRESDTHEIVELRRLLGIPPGVRPRDCERWQIDRLQGEVDSLADCLFEGILHDDKPHSKWRKAARKALRINAPQTYRKLVSYETQIRKQLASEKAVTK